MSDSMTNLRAAIARVRADMPDWHDTELHAAMTIVCAAAERAATPVAMRHVTGREEAITHAVSRFLQWELPRTFGPDCGISFDGRKPDQWNPVRQWPVGTNLFTADEARAMFDYCLPTTLSHVEPIPPASASEPTRHPCGHLIVSDECVACVKPASEPQAEPPADALVEEESISDMLSRHDRETRAAILRAHHKMIGAEAKRDAVERQMQTFNAVVQERDAKIVEATERAERAESALAAANEREEGLREAMQKLIGMIEIAAVMPDAIRKHLLVEWDDPILNEARAALARKEGE